MQFQSFGNRVASVNVDVTHKVRRVDATASQRLLFSGVQDLTALPSPVSLSLNALPSTETKVDAKRASLEASLSVSESSCFVTALKRWRELDLTQSFVDFDKAIHTYALSLPLVSCARVGFRTTHSTECAICVLVFVSGK